ncbi:MAG: plastocyanin/azurin family copper-binding protein [Solirubrobacteraceae bacterium]
MASLGLAAAVLPAIASSETSSTVTAENVGGAYGEEHRWTPPRITVNAGGGVTFSNPTEVKHGVHWINPPAAPTCDSGVPVGTTETASGTKWIGACTFTQAGTYTYYCTVHGAAMSGTITVNPGGTTTPTTGTTTPTGTTTTPTIETPSGSPLVGGPSLRASQRGTSVRGSLDISQAGAGDRLEVDLFASSASLAKTRHATRVRVGRFVRGSAPAGRQSFAVTLDTKARRALKHRRRLALTVKIALTPVYGETTTLTRAVVVHP